MKIAAMERATAPLHARLFHYQSVVQGESFPALEKAFGDLPDRYERCLSSCRGQSGAAGGRSAGTGARLPRHGGYSTLPPSAPCGACAAGLAGRLDATSIGRTLKTYLISHIARDSAVAPGRETLAPQPLNLE